jgi:hypothetical protein
MTDKYRERIDTSFIKVVILSQSRRKGLALSLYDRPLIAKAVQ